VIVHGSNQSLPRTKISFRGFDRPMTEEKLDLFEFSSCGMTQPRASATKVMGSQMVNASKFGVLAHYPPHRFLTQVVALHAADSHPKPLGALYPANAGCKVGT
jgi:hypothetical protein